LRKRNKNQNKVESLLQEEYGWTNILISEDVEYLILLYWLPNVKRNHLGLKKFPWKKRD